MNEKITITKNERDFLTPHEIYKKLCKQNDIEIYREFQMLSESKINCIIRPLYKDYKINTLKKINKMNEKEGINKVQEIDLNDSDVLVFINESDQYNFLRVARILDFYDGFQPTEQNN